MSQSPSSDPNNAEFVIYKSSQVDIGVGVQFHAIFTDLAITLLREKRSREAFAISVVILLLG